LRSSIVQEGDIQAIVPYALYREALLWTGEHIAPLTRDEWSIGKPPYDIPENRLEGLLGQAQ